VDQLLKSLPVPEVEKLFNSIPSPVPINSVISSASSVATIIDGGASSTSCRKQLLSGSEFYEIPDELASNLDDDDGDANASVSSAHSKSSRFSEKSGFSGSNRICGSIFQGSVNGGVVCPFPEEWQYQVIPECIGNDEEVD